jgi:hypothetical protein
MTEAEVKKILGMDIHELPDLSTMNEASHDLDEQKEQERQQWLADRRGNFNASEIQVFFTQKLQIATGATVNAYLHKKAAEILGSYEEEKFARPLDWGKTYEVEAAEEKMKRTGQSLFYYGDNQKYLNIGDIGATPDGLHLVDEEGCAVKWKHWNNDFLSAIQEGAYICLNQIKCPYDPANHAKHLTVKTHQEFRELVMSDSSVKKHYCQVQHEMYVASKYGYRVTGTDFISYDPRMMNDYPELALHVIRVLPDVDFQERLKEALERARTAMKSILNKIHR